MSQNLAHAPRLLNGWPRATRGSEPFDDRAVLYKIWRRSQPSLVPDWISTVRRQLRRPPYAAFRQGPPCFGQCGASLCATPLIPSLQVKVSKHTGLQTLSCVLLPYITTSVLLSASVAVSVVLYTVAEQEQSNLQQRWQAPERLERLVSLLQSSLPFLPCILLSHRIISCRCSQVTRPSMMHVVVPSEATAQRSGPPGTPID